MRRTIVVAILGLLALVVPTSCSGPGTKVTVSVETRDHAPILPLSVAYQVGDGEWSWLRPGEDASYGFVVPPSETRYGVAVRCPGMGPDVTINIYQLTLDDTAHPVFFCGWYGKPRIRLPTHVDVSGVTGARSYHLLYETSSHDYYRTVDDLDLSVLPGTGRDVLLMAYSSSGAGWPSPADLLAGRLFRNLTFEEGTSLDLALSNADALGTRNVWVENLPGGWNASYAVGLITRGGVVQFRAVLGEGTSSGTYCTLANPGEGDLYTLDASASNMPMGGPFLSVGAVHAVPAATAGDLVAGLPEPYPQDYAPDTTGPAVAFDLPQAAGTAGYTLQLERDDSGALVWVSTAWLGERTRYTMPDLSELPGFEPVDPSPDPPKDWGVCTLVSELDLAEITGDPGGEALLPYELGKPFEVDYACAYSD